MALSKGVIDFGSNFNIGRKGPIDARLVADYITDLSTGYSDTGLPCYRGMVVSVLEDNCLYLLVNDDPTAEGAWLKLGSESAIDSINTFLKSFYAPVNLSLTDNTTNKTNIKAFVDNYVQYFTPVDVDSLISIPIEIGTLVKGFLYYTYGKDAADNFYYGIVAAGAPSGGSQRCDARGYFIKYDGNTGEITGITENEYDGKVKGDYIVDKEILDTTIDGINANTLVLTNYTTTGIDYNKVITSSDTINQAIAKLDLSVANLRGKLNAALTTGSIDLNRGLYFNVDDKLAINIASSTSVHLDFKSGGALTASIDSISDTEIDDLFN